MGVKERVISIRLIEMIYRNPEYADKIGLKGEITNFKNVEKQGESIKLKERR